MNPQYFLVALAILSATLHLPDFLTAALWVLNFTQPFALEYYKHWLTSKAK